MARAKNFSKPHCFLEVLSLLLVTGLRCRSEGKWRKTFNAPRGNKLSIPHL